MSTSITKDIAFCQQLLKDKKLVAIPTETVYGLAANAFDNDAVQQIFQMKGRPKFNPLIVHIHNVAQLEMLATNIPKNALKLAKRFWPGPLTLILPKQELISDLVTAGKATVGIRMPNHKTTLALLEGLDFPLVAPSANPFTRISPTSAQHVADYFGTAIPAILDGGPCRVGLESTIVGFEADETIIYRKGGISIDEIKAVVGDVRLTTTNETAPQAPGMLLKHYAPKTAFVVTNAIETELQKHEGKRVGVISFFKTSFPKVRVIKTLSLEKNIEEAASKLFASLHELDGKQLDIIIAEKFPEEGLGISINDRLERAQK